MGIIIKEENNKYFLYSVYHTPYNLTPYTNPEAIQDFVMCYKNGQIKELDNLEINKEYENLNSDKDFEIVERIPQVKHENGLVYDDLIYKLK